MWTYLKYKLVTLIIKCLPLMIKFVDVHQVISELLLGFFREKSILVLGNYNFNSSEYNGKLEGPTSIFTLLTISRQGKIFVLWWATESKVIIKDHFLLIIKKKFPNHANILVYWVITISLKMFDKIIRSNMGTDREKIINWAYFKGV